MLMTAFGTPDVVDAAQALGVHRVVHKPFDMDDIARAVEQANQRSVSHQESRANHVEKRGVENPPHGESRGN